MNRRNQTSPLAASRTLTIIIILALLTSAFAHSFQGDRAADIERTIAERARQISDDPNDPILLADQATDYYFEYLSIEAAGWTTILGVPNDSQRERARRASRHIYELARRAEAAIEEAIFILEAKPDYADNLDLQRERRRLVEEERDRRIPFLIGVGASVRGHADELTPDERNARLSTALETLKAVAPRLGGPVAAHAHVHAGIAASVLGQVEKARNLFDEAEAHAEGDPLVRFAARLALATLDSAQAQRNLDRLAADPDYVRSAFHRLLIADRLFMAREPRSKKDAVNAYVALLDASLEISRENARDIIVARIADATKNISEAERPPFAMIASAERSLRAEQPDPAAIEEMDRLLKAVDLSNIERAHATLTLARLQQRLGRQLEAARTYIRLAREHSDRPEAERAMEVALALAADRYRVDPAGARETLHEGIELALQSYPRLSTIDRWRFVAGRLALNEGRYEDAIERLGAVGESHERAIDAAALRIEALRRLAASIDDSARRSAHVREMIASIDLLAPRLSQAASQAGADRAAALRRTAHQVRIHRAFALTMRDEPQAALDVLDGFEDEPDVDGPLIAEALQARIEALQALGRVGEAQGQIVEFIEQATAGQVRAVLGALLSSIESRVKEMRARHREEEAKRIADAELAPLVSRLDAWMSEDDARFDAAFALRLADGHRLVGAYEAALRLYDRLLEAHPNALPLLLGRAECLYQIGVASERESTLGDAMAIYRRLIAAGAEMHDVYWKAQLRSLQILDAINRNTHQIVPQIQRLRLRDPGLGGDRFRPEFERLQNKHAN